VAAVDDFNWDDLRYFLRAAQTKTLAGAARSMGVERTTIGRRLSALERALGAALVLRGPDGLTLTPLGQRCSLTPSRNSGLTTPRSHWNSSATTGRPTSRREKPIWPWS
jgi:hypothetical protein